MGIYKEPAPVPEILFDDISEFPGGLADIIPLTDRVKEMRLEGDWVYEQRTSSLAFSVIRPIMNPNTKTITDGPNVECEIYPLSVECPRTTDNCGIPSATLRNPKLILAALLDHPYCLNNPNRMGEHFYLVPSDPEIIEMREVARSNKDVKADLNAVATERKATGIQPDETARRAAEAATRNARKKEPDGIGAPPAIAVPA